MVKNLSANAIDTGDGFNPWVGEIPCRKEWLPTPVLLPGEFLGQWSLVGYSPWGHKELDTTGQLSTHTHSQTHLFIHSFSHVFISALTEGHLFDSFDNNSILWFLILMIKQKQIRPMGALLSCLLCFLTCFHSFLFLNFHI